VAIVQSCTLAEDPAGGDGALPSMPGEGNSGDRHNVFCESCGCVFNIGILVAFFFIEIGSNAAHTSSGKERRVIPDGSASSHQSSGFSALASSYSPRS